MSVPIITVENVSKRYVISHQAGARDGLRHTLERAIRHPLRWLRERNQQARDGQEEFWALRDVSFEVKPGEVLGIIGRNGAGKSTLLKILSRITEPTSGRIQIDGRVASLLEVGTGFHPELTGRENIYLNGAILGMSRIEIKRKFDEIVAFSEVEKFLDTPVKRYSSGMYVRLAFAVAAHLEPEILIIDEVLAVGDAQFQKKCLGKMGQVSKQGRTVLFVSHNMAAVQTLCNQAMVLRTGRVDFSPGAVAGATARYFEEVGKLAQVALSDRTDRQGEGRLRITGFAALDPNGRHQETLLCGKPVEFRILFRVESGAVRNVTAAISISSVTGVYLCNLSSEIAALPFAVVPQSGYIACRVNKLPLSPGGYMLNLFLKDNNAIQDWIQEAITISVEAGDFFGTGRLPPPSHAGFLIEQDWSVNGNLASVRIPEPSRS